MLNKLPNGDSYSTLTVSPANWMSTNAPMGVWYIQYRYYYKDGESKQVLIKGMNRYKDRIERQRVTLELLQQEEKKLQNVNSNSQIPLIDALNLALTGLTVTKQTMVGMRHVVRKVEIVIKKEHLNIPVNTVTRKHIKQVLDGCYSLSERFSDKSYNHWWRYLSILFKQLIEIEAVDNNPVTNIANKRTVRKMLTSDEWLD